MMKIQMKATMAGPQGAFRSGDVLELDNDVAQSLVAGGYATPLLTPFPPTSGRRPPPELQGEGGPEIAALEPEETAVKVKAKPRRRRKRRSSRITDSAGSED